MRRIFFIVFMSLVFLGGCFREKIPSVARKDLFTINIGKLEDQIDLFNLEGERSNRKTDIAMRDGLLYISNGNGRKIVRYNSYGDLLFMIYNEEQNPPPLTLRRKNEGQGIVTRWAYAYPLREPGIIAVDSRKHIYVEDRLPQGQESFDEKNKASLDRRVLHFDIDGRFVKYLGQEGVGGTPFPNIIGIYTSVNDELAVVCRLSTGWNIYWFDAAGTLLYLIHLGNDDIPIPLDRDLVIPFINSLCVSPDERRLYLQVDYYRDTYDVSTNTRSGSEPDSSVIWIMDVENGTYTRTVEVPFYESLITQNNRKITENMFYSMLGVIENSKIFLYFPVEEGYSILILSSESQEQRRGFIRVDNEELQFNTFNLSSEGILSALLATDWEVRMVWWRTDELIGDVSS
ncbi:MAG: hypothetical protein LBB78_07260 [Spirochaetaceae bacterium]|jgi:hypothetical protein|nr:hypothetical protein [Spirochaetaceae bacterium]